MSEVHKLEVVIEGSDAKLKQALKDAAQSTKRMTDAINSELRKIKSPAAMLQGNGINEVSKSIKDFKKKLQLAAGVKVHTDEYKNLSQDISNTEKELDGLKRRMAGLDESKRYVPTQEFKDLEKSIQKSQTALGKLREKESKMKSSGKATVPTEDYVEAGRLLADAEKRLAQLVEKQKEWKDLGVPDGGSSGAMGTLEKDIKETEKEIAFLKEELKDLEFAGEANKPTLEFRELTNEIYRTEKQLKEYREQRDQMVQNGTDQQESEAWRKVTLGIASAERQLEGYKAKKNSLEASGKDVRFSGEGIRNLAATGVSKGFSGMQSVFKKITTGIKESGGAFASLIQKFKNGAHASNQTNNSFKAGIGTMLKYGLGIRSLYVLFGKLRGAMQDGMRNLAQYSQTTNANLSTLQSGLNQVKNSLATAFAPVLNVVTPILSTLIDYLVAAASAVAQFMAALTGQGTYTVAKRVATDYAAGLNSAGAAADGANESAKELKKTLMGFDQINKLDDDSSSGGSGGSGGGGGAGIGDMFETETVTNQFADFAEKIKQAWTDADFTEIGTIIGTKLKEGLDNIPWDGIKETAEKIGKSVATLINGFVETSGLGTSIGNTVAQAINTGVLGANAFLTNLHWESVGQFVADSMNGFIATADWAGAGEAVRNGVNGVFKLAATWSEKFDFSAAGEKVKEALNSALEGIEWENAITAADKIGKGVANALNKVMTKDTFSNVGKTAAGALNTVFSGAYSFIGTVDWKGWGTTIATGINTFFKDLDWKKAGLTFSGAAHGILTTLKNAVKGVGWKEVGEDIAEFIKGIDFKTLLSDVGNIIWAAINAGIEAWKSSFDEAPIETTIVTTILGLKFTGLGALFGKKIWNILKDGISSEASGDDSGTTDSGAGGAFVSGVVTWLKNSATSIGLKVGGWSGFLNQVFQTVGGITSPLGVLSDPEIVNYMGNEWNSLIEGLKPYVKEGMDNLNGYIEENPLRILPGYGLLEDGIDFLKKGLESAKDFLKGWKSGISGNDETPEIEAGETDPSGELPLQVIHGKLVVDEIDLPNETDPNRASVSVKATISEFSIPEAIKKLSGLSAVLTGGISPVTGAVLTGIGAIVSTVSKATGINSLQNLVASISTISKATGINILQNLAASILNVRKSGNPVLEAIQATISNAKQGYADKNKPDVNVGGNVISAKQGYKDKKKPNVKVSGNVISAKQSYKDRNKPNVNVGGKAITAYQGYSDSKKPSVNVSGNVTSGKKAGNWGIALSGAISLAGLLLKATLKRGGGIYKNGSWRPITAAADGGAFSTGQMFVAREAGPELVGTIGRSTAVMNNNQIVSSVAAGVYQAVVAAMAASGGGQKSRPVFNIYVGGRKITDVVIEEINNRTIATGQCPILM